MQSPDTANSRKTTEIKRSEALEAIVAAGAKDIPSVPVPVPMSPQALPMFESTAQTLPPDNLLVTVTQEQPPVDAPEDVRPLLTDPAYYLNRELSLLAFQWRVLEEAMDGTNPLMERFRFLSILGSNLEEFFMVRVAGLKRQIESGTPSAGPDGLSPSEQLDAVSSEVTRLLASAHDCLKGSLLPELKMAGIQILQFDELTDEQKIDAREYFRKKIFPVLTPLAFDPGHPFPHISNLSLNLAVLDS
jgi:hypothetical protein